MASSRRDLSALNFVLVALFTLGAQVRHVCAESLIELRLGNAPHAPEDAPDVIVHVPTRIARNQPLHVLVFLHGFSSCARALVAAEPTPCSAGAPPQQRAYRLAKLHEQASSNSILLVPQLAFLSRDASAPRFEASGGFDAFLKDVRTQLAAQLDPNAPFASVTLIAHSAGYRAAAAILRDPARKAPINNVVLLDALYAHWDVFAEFVRADPKHHLLSLYTHDRATTRGNRNLAALLHVSKKKHSEGEPSASRQLTQEQVDTPHGLIPTRHLAEVLQRLFPAR
jgi:hypothetical protein